jgi:hypothetical protein
MYREYVLINFSCSRYDFLSKITQTDEKLLSKLIHPTGLIHLKSTFFSNTLYNKKPYKKPTTYPESISVGKCNPK